MLTEKRKADRETMAARLHALAIEHGAQAEIIHDWPGDNPRCIMVEIRAARGLGVAVDFDGSSTQPDNYCMPWHIADSDACLSDRFGMAARGSVNPVHFHKCTAFARGFDELCERVAAGLDMARDGSAFDAEREARQVAKNGTAADSALRFAAWRQGEGWEPAPIDPAELIAQAEAFERYAALWESPVPGSYASGFDPAQRAHTAEMNRQQAADLRTRAAEMRRAAA